MASLNNPVGSSNLVQRFNDFVAATANANIEWGTDSKPFDEMPNSSFGGSTSGMGDTTGNLNLTGEITASTLVSAFTNATKRYTRIRRLRARLNVLGDGGNRGTRPTKGIVYDETAVAHLNSSYEQNPGYIAESGVISGELISRANFQGGAVFVPPSTALAYTGFFNECRAKYETLRQNRATITIDVCHASCHSSCHSSRIRR
jgi:hypothetical protein